MSTVPGWSETDRAGRIRRVVRPAFAVVLALHGIVHWIGFAVPFGLMTTESNPFTTTALWGLVDLGDAGAKFLGLAYLALIVPFVVVAVGVWREARWALPLTVVVAALSAVVCALGSPSAVVGLVLNVVVIAIVLCVPRLLTAWERPFGRG